MRSNHTHPWLSSTSASAVARSAVISRSRLASRTWLRIFGSAASTKVSPFSSYPNRKAPREGTKSWGGRGGIVWLGLSCSKSIDGLDEPVGENRDRTTTTNLVPTSSGVWSSGPSGQQRATASYRPCPPCSCPHHFLPKTAPRPVFLDTRQNRAACVHNCPLALCERPVRPNISRLPSAHSRMLTVRVSCNQYERR